MKRKTCLSARTRRTVSTLGLAGILALPGVHACGREWQDLILTPLADPLLARPPELDNGTLLPGDEIVHQCAGDAPGMPAAAAVAEAAVAPVALTLSEAIQRALCHHPQIKSTWAGIRQQAAQVGEARAAYLPVLTAGMSRLRQKTQFPESSFQANTDRTSESQYYSLTWRLLDFGGRDANRRAANATLEAALATHDATMQKLMANIIGLYFDAQTARATRQAKQTGVLLARQTLDATLKKQTTGAGAQTDTLQAQTLLAKAELELARASGGYAKALVALKVAMGMALAGEGPTSGELELARDLGDGQQQWQSSLQEWLTLVEVRHPAIVAARAQLRAAQERLTVARSEGLPTLDASMNRYRNGRPNQGLPGTETRETTVGLTLNIPLFDGFSRTYKIRGAQAQIELKEAELQDTSNQVLGEVAKAHADMLSAWSNLDSSARLLDSAREAQTSVHRKFERGAADILDILNTQSALADAEQERIRALADWRSARLRLFASAGMAGIRLVGK